MAGEKSSEPRAQHFVPQCWLAGFTENGQKTGRLWVTDLKRGKQWQSNPSNAGHRRDFYRISHSQLDPVAFEKAFSHIEGAVAPILKSLYEDPRTPVADELERLLFLAAFQYVRVPAFRPFVLKIADSLNRASISEALKSPASWANALKKAGIPANSPGASYEDTFKFQRDIIERALREWLELAPSDRILWGTDAHHAEAIYTAAEFTRRCANQMWRLCGFVTCRVACQLLMDRKA